MSHIRLAAGRASGRAARALAALLLSLGLVGLAAGCGMDAQLLQPYNPADGTNIDVGEDGTLKVRNLLVVATAEGEGYLSATVVSNAEERLTGATVAPQTLEGTSGPPAPVTLPAPIELTPGELLVLTDQPLLRVTAPDLRAGASATVVMQFAQAGPVTLDCPVVDGTVPPWSDITASGSPSASASPGENASPSSEAASPSGSPSGSATPGGGAGDESASPSPSPSGTS